MCTISSSGTTRFRPSGATNVSCTNPGSGPVVTSPISTQSNVAPGTARYPCKPFKGWDYEKIYVIFIVMVMFFGGQALSAATQQSSVLLEANSVCGDGIIYSVNAGKFKKIEIERLKIILRFRHSGEKINGYFEDYAERKVTTEDMATLSSKKEFSKWIGPDVFKAIQGLITRRRSLHSKQATLNALKFEDFMKSSEVKEYIESADALTKTLEQKFGITEKDNGVSCD